MSALTAIGVGFVLTALILLEFEVLNKRISDLEELLRKITDKPEKE